MRIVIEGSTVSLTDPEVFTAFDVLAPDQSPEQVVEALGSAGLAAEEADHVFVSVAAVRSLADSAASEDWQAGFQGMLDYAGSKGWLDSTGNFIKAHISER